MKEQLYLLGHPIGHSKSPALYQALCDHLGLSWTYGLMDCATEDDARSFLETGDFLGINITTPYKPLAFEMSSIKAASAKLARGANVLLKRGDALIAYNMDGEGCIDYLERTGFEFAGAQVVVCGTGPTARAIVHACALAGASRVVLVGRNKERTKKVLEAYVAEYGQLAFATIELPPARAHHRSFRAAYKETDFAYGSYRTSHQVFDQADLVINATVLGMKEGDGAPFDTTLLHSEQTVLDVVYGHGETALVKAARREGCTAHDGAGMLVAQAVATALALLDVAGIDADLSRDELFSIMARGGGFDL